MSKFKAYIPIFASIIFILGIFLGYYLHPGAGFSDHVLKLPAISGSGKISTVLHYIQNDYVDSVDMPKMEEDAIREMISDLDPHSQYITAEEFNQVNDPLEGNFEGIGVQFRIEKDTIMIVQTITGGPSEKVGLRAGDRIVTIENDTVAGVGITNEAVIKKLKGPRGTKVNIGIRRKGIPECLAYTITRDVIPTYSMDIAFMPSDSIGYIKLSRFAATSYDEVRLGILDLLEDGARKLIFDLRANSGGYLQAAINLADAFLKNGKLIVYTEGRNRPRQYAYATKQGLFENYPLVILIDEGSASASEILAGAIQDNDRGIVMGRRSFGKGLVQEQMRLNDGSAVRLTVARYYTPTGRSIQKPYNNGKTAYYEDLYHRWQNGELESADSIHFNDSLKYKTPKGKVVYGGGGIMPDVFVSIEEERTSDFMDQILRKGIIYSWTFEYADTHRHELEKYGHAEKFINQFEITTPIFRKFLKYATNKASCRETVLIKKPKQR